MLFGNRKVIEACDRSMKVPKLRPVEIEGVKFYIPIVHVQGRHNGQKPRNND